METAEIKKVDLSPIRNRGRYSKIILRLKSASIGASLLPRGTPAKNTDMPRF
jgi:hypothetical protein